MTHPTLNAPEDTTSRPEATRQAHGVAERRAGGMTKPHVLVWVQYYLGAYWMRVACSSLAMMPGVADREKRAWCGGSHLTALFTSKAKALYHAMFFACSLDPRTIDVTLEDWCGSGIRQLRIRR